MTKKKLITVFGTDKNWYDKVIFVVNSSSTYQVPLNLVSEAESIINNYINNENSNCYSNYYDVVLDENLKVSNTKSRNKLVNCILIFSILLCTSMFVYMFRTMYFG